MNMNDKIYAGIDLGTTNTVLAIATQKPNGEVTSKVINLPRATDEYSTVGADEYTC